MKISIMCLFRDAEDHLQECFQRLESLENNTNASFKYCFYENDSQDDTKEILKEWLKNRNHLLISEDLGAPKFSTICGQHEQIYRNFYMTQYRNTLLFESRLFLSDYTLILDSDIKFDKNLINDYIKYMSDDVVMTTPNTTQNINCQMYDNSKRSYYDCYALIDNNMNHGMLWSSNPFYNQEDIVKWNSNKPVEVFSAFGGCPLIKSYILNNIHWHTNGNCEHWFFCQNVRKFGKILVIPTIKTQVHISQNLLDKISKEHMQNVIKKQKKILNDKYST